MDKKKEKKELSQGVGLLKESVMEDYLNREDFSYNPNGDALYRYYRDRYTEQGKTAMADTMGQAAALTGGYGSSYAQNVGQQAYNSYMKELGDVIPQLYQLAYDRYRDQGDDLLQRYDLLDQQEQQEYDRYRDQVADDQWQQTQQEKKRQYDQDYALNQQRFTEEQRQFNQNYALDQQQLDEDQRQFNQSYDLDQQRLNEDRRQFDQSHALAVSKEEKKDAPDSYYAWLNTAQGAGTRPDSSNRYEIAYDNGNVKTGDILAMQRVLGVEETGMWSATSRSACGGLTADEAFELYKQGRLSQVRATT